MLPDQQVERLNTPVTYVLGARHLTIHLAPGVPIRNVSTPKHSPGQRALHSVASVPLPTDRASTDAADAIRVEMLVDLRRRWSRWTASGSGRRAGRCAEDLGKSPSGWGAANRRRVAESPSDPRVVGKW